ncbi:nitrate regulatory protein [Microbulbifer aestuariivivens]|uniref:Nitrate regulatory protein n=1 Tax=Microbulbifer aestuariivivens TaxID=1908308 RepID=A0ABP9WS16_9GAMM
MDRHNAGINSESFFLAAQQAKIRQLEDLMSALQWVDVICDLIHALQRERGLSNVYLVCQKTTLANEFTEQLLICDKALAEFNAALPPLLQGRESANPSLLNLIAGALSTLEQLPALRASNQTRELLPIDSTLAYNRTIETLLLIVFELIDLATDPDVAQSLTAFFLLIQLKEYVGQERAWTLIGFSRGHFIARLQERLNRLSMTQQEVRERMLNCADSELLDAYERLNSGPVAMDLNRFRQVRNNLSAGSEVNTDLTDVWYHKITDYIDALHTIETQAMRSIILLCMNRIETAQQSNNLVREKLDELNEMPDIPVSQLLKGSAESSPIQALIAEQQRQIQSLQLELSNSRKALEARKLVERAKSILMNNLHLSEEDSFRRLQKSAMDQNSPLEEIAKKVISAHQSYSKN